MRPGLVGGLGEAVAEQCMPELIDAPGLPQHATAMRVGQEAHQLRR
jgi:hypothetical protein